MIETRSWLSTVQEIASDLGPAESEPLVKVAVGAVITNPYAGGYSESLDELIDYSVDLSKELVARAKNLLGDREPMSCGKAALIGAAGEQEHGVACLTTPFGDAMREGIGGNGWVVSTTKVSGAGGSIDIPLAYKKALFVREFYDTITLSVPNGPRDNEIVVIAALASRGRVHHRVGGLALEDAVGDGLR